MFNGACAPFNPSLRPPRRTPLRLLSQHPGTPLTSALTRCSQSYSSPGGVNATCAPFATEGSAAITLQTSGRRRLLQQGGGGLTIGMCNIKGKRRPNGCGGASVDSGGYGVDGFRPDGIRASPPSTLVGVSDSTKPNVTVACDISLADKQVGWWGHGA